MVIVNYLCNEGAALAVVEACPGGGRAVGGCHVRAAVEAMLAQITEESGRIDVLVNNAFRPTSSIRTTGRGFGNRLDGLSGAIRWGAEDDLQCLQSGLPLMRAADGGTIVNIATDLVARPSIAYHDYTTANPP